MALSGSRARIAFNSLDSGPCRGMLAQFEEGGDLSFLEFYETGFVSFFFSLEIVVDDCGRIC